jgi:hypothetical protein
MRITEFINESKKEESKERCKQCGMTNCSCKPGTCKCKPIEGWVPNKGFRKAMAEGEQDLDKSNSNNAIQARQKKADDAAKRFMDEPKYNNSNQDRQKKADHAAKRFMQGVAEGLSESVSLRDMVNVVDQHYPKYYAELSGSDISDKQFERAIVNAYKKIMQKQGVAEDWNKVNHHDKTSGMSQKAVNAYRRENPGSKLKTAVTTKPSKLKPGSKAANRRKSFCARMGGNKGPMKKPNGKPTPKALALRRWNCESIEELQELVMLAEQFVNKKKNESI